MPPTYRERLRREGLTLAASGAAGSAALLVLAADSRSKLRATGVGLVSLVALLEGVGSRALRRRLDHALELEAGGEGSGEPVPLWRLPVAPLGAAAAGAALARGGRNAALGFTGASCLAGLWQAVRWERIVAADERRRGRRYFRTPGTRVLSGMGLGYARAA